MIARLITIWICNLIDTISTLYFYTYHGGIELNPISAELLHSPQLFVTFKLFIMTIAVTFLWWKQDLKFCKIASWILFVEYLLVVFYYILLFIIV